MERNNKKMNIVLTLHDIIGLVIVGLLAIALLIIGGYIALLYSKRGHPVFNRRVTSQMTGQFDKVFHKIQHSWTLTTPEYCIRID